MISDPPEDPPDGSEGRFDIPAADETGVFSGCLSCLGFLGIVAVVTVVLILIPSLASAGLSMGYVTLARTVTGGDPDGMAAAAWLLFFTVSAGYLVLVLIRERAAKPWTRLVGAVVTVLGLTVLSLLPTWRRGLLVLASGEGGSGFITGARWGVPAAAVLLIIAASVQARKRAKDFYVRHSLLRWTIGSALVFALATLVTAIVRAG